jgi:hypothetical protein
MPTLQKSARREEQRRKQPQRRKMSGPGLKAARNRKRALEAKYA